MQQFQVPQFIEVEDKIFGPLTTKQFFYLLGGGGLTFLIWFFIKNFFFFVLLSTPVIALSVSLAFVKINGRPFIDLISNFFYYLTRPRLYLWQKRQKRAAATGEIDALRKGLIVPKVSGNKINDLAWSLDIMQNVRKQETPPKPKDDTGIILKV